MSEPASLFEAKLRFPGCPPTCLAANLPSFKTKAEAKSWPANLQVVEDVWECHHCLHWHVWSRAPRPSGALPRLWKPFIHRTVGVPIDTRQLNLAP